MAYISEEIVETAAALGFPIDRLPAERTARIREELRNRFGLDPDHFSIHLTKDYESVHSTSGWSWISEFLGTGEVLMLFPPSSDPEAWRFPTGDMVVPLLSECSGFVFILTCPSFEYLLAFEEHDCLVGAGTAREWIRTMKQRKADTR